MLVVRDVSAVAARRARVWPASSRFVEPHRRGAMRRRKSGRKVGFRQGESGLARRARGAIVRAVLRGLAVFGISLSLAACASTEEAARIGDDYGLARVCLDSAEGDPVPDPAGAQEPVAQPGSAGSARPAATVNEGAARAARLKTCREVCDRGVAVGCWALGRAALVGAGRDPKQALTEFDAGCSLGDAASCVEAGVLAERGAGGPGDATLALRYFRTACDLDHPTGCSNLGLAFQAGEVVPKDEVRASQLYQRGCNGGDAAGCANLAFLMQYGIGVPRNDRRARELYEESCRRKHAGACANLATMLLAGRGGEREEGRAAAIYEDQCREGRIEGCANLGVLLESGTGRPRDPNRAQQLYERACGAGVSEACMGLGRLFEASGAAGMAEAARLYRRVCGATSDRDACDRFERVKRELDGDKPERP